MSIPVKPLRACIDQYKNTMESKDWSKATLAALNNIMEKGKERFRGSSDKHDLGRAMIWFANAEFARRGIAPRYRSCMPSIVRIPETPAQAINKEDAPYIDLQWLAIHYPEHPLPLRLRELVNIDKPENPFSLGVSTDAKGFLRDAFGRAEKIVRSRGSLTRKIKNLALTKVQQIGMRRFCGKAISERIRDVNIESANIRDRIDAQQIPQLRNKPSLVNRRVSFWTAWKLTGSSSRWQEAADVFNFMHGESVSRQAVRDLIGRMKSSRIIRRNRRKSVRKPVL